jgi:hypothetical protein
VKLFLAFILIVLAQAADAQFLERRPFIRQPASNGGGGSGGWQDAIAFSDTDTDAATSQFMSWQTYTVTGSTASGVRIYVSPIFGSSADVKVAIYDNMGVLVPGTSTTIHLDGITTGYASNTFSAVSLPTGTYSWAFVTDPQSQHNFRYKNGTGKSYSASFSSSGNFASFPPATLPTPDIGVSDLSADVGIFMNP